MAAFSATDAAFEGFRLVRRNPLTLVVWSLLYLLVFLPQLFLMRGMGEAMERLEAATNALNAGPQPPTPADLAPAFEALGQMLGGIALLLPLVLIVSAVIAAAIARGVLEPENKAFGYVRLGMDEVRVFGVSLVIAITFSASLIVASLMAAVVTGLAAEAAGGLGGLLGLLIFIGLVFVCIWLVVRLSLAVPITVAERRFAPFASFDATQGRFWPLLGMGVLAFVMTLVVQLLAGLVALPVNVMAGLGMAQGMGADPSTLFKAFDVSNPWVIASGVLSAVIQAMSIGVLSAPFAAAYRDIRRG